MKKCKYCKSEIDDKAKICPNCNKKQKGGCFTVFGSICVIIFLVILISSLSGNKKEDEANSNTGTVSVNSSEISAENSESAEKTEGIKQEAEQIIYDENDIKITYKGFSQAGVFKSASFDFLIENNSSQNVVVTSEKVSVNDFTVTDFLYEDIASGKKCNSGVTLYNYYLEENDIESINKIEFNLKFSNPDTFETLFTSDKITITLNENTDMGGVPEGSQLIHEQDGISVYYVKNTGGSWLAEDGIKFYIQNDTDKNILISSDNVTVNDFTMDTALLYADIEAHKKANDTMDLISSEIEKNGITEIEKVDFTLKCYDEDTYNSIWETDTITITMK